MAAAVCTAASPLLPLPASKKRPAAGRASSSSSWIKDKIERESSREGSSSSWIKVERGSPREGPSLCGSTVRGRASLSKNWTRDKLERSEAQIQRMDTNKARKEGCGFEAARRQEEILAAARRQEEILEARQHDELVAVAYYAGPAFNNSPDPSALAIPFFVRSPDPSEVSFPADFELANCSSLSRAVWAQLAQHYCIPSLNLQMVALTIKWFSGAAAAAGSLALIAGGFSGRRRGRINHRLLHLPRIDLKLATASTSQSPSQAAVASAICISWAWAAASHLTDPPPDTTDKDAKDWRAADNRVMATLAMSVDPTIRFCLEDHTTAKEMWDFLKQRYQQSSSALRYSILKQLHHLQQQDMTVEEYHAVFIKLSSQLDSMVPKPCSTCKDCVARDKYERQNKMFHFVMGLRSEFEPIRAQLLGRPTLPTMAEALSAVIAEETRLCTIAAPDSVSQHSVLAASPQYVVMDSSFVSKEKPKCKHCGNKTHPEEWCFKKYPHLLKEFRAKRASSQKGTAAAAPPVMPPITTSIAAPQSPTPIGAYMSGGSIASASVSDGSTCIVTHHGNLAISNLTVSNDRRTQALLGTGRRHKGSFGLYILDHLHLPLSSSTSSPPSSSSFASPAVTFPQWHHRLGHLCGSRLSTLVKQGALGKVSVDTSFECTGCKLGKQIQLPYPTSVSRSTNPFDLVHSDGENICQMLFINFFHLKEAVGIPAWEHAMSEELAALQHTSTWEVVPLPPHAVPITCKWVYKVKTKADGSIERYKARLVARGFQQSYGRDYEETFAPVAHMTSVRALIAVAAVRSWTIFQLDVKNAFLHGDLHEEVYMQPPPGFKVPDGYVCRLRRALYGLKQAPRAWFERFTLVVKAAGFTPSDHDPALFVHVSERGRTLLLLYVDDMLITGDDDEYIAFVKARLAEQFMMSDLGPLSYFLGIEVTSTPRGYYLSQHKYLQDLIARSGLIDTRIVATPMELNLKLRANDGTPLADPSRYRHVVGSLVYLTITRLDIAHVVHILSQFVSVPTLVHYAHLLRVLRYLQGTASQRLFYAKSSPLQLHAYSDSTWASDPTDRRSITGYCIFIGTSPIAWKSKRVQYHVLVLKQSSGPWPLQQQR
ncbi:hypothetical protein U9M48_039142 [Paspalum notatum var. saurae]|uniref:Uncharacterized protein n=1 Tax=Paspalum notatum var. saurae TaxID=547442 RepID=A0AAQ3UJH5_PASNO